MGRCHQSARVAHVKWWGFVMGFAKVGQGGGQEHSSRMMGSI